AAYERYVATDAFEEQVRTFVARSRRDASADEPGPDVAVERRTGIAGMAVEAVRTGGVALLDRPLGRLGRWLPEDASRRLVATAAPAVWEQVIDKLPAL